MGDVQVSTFTFARKYLSLPKILYEHFVEEILRLYKWYNRTCHEITFVVMFTDFFDLFISTGLLQVSKLSM